MNRTTGVMLLGAGTVLVLALALVPIPGFHDLTPRSGTLVEAGRERFSPCRRGDCTRTMVTVRHRDGVRSYNFADADPGTLVEGAPMTVWAYPHVRGLRWQRAWHAEQGGRVIRDHAALAASDRRIRLATLLLAPVLLLWGGWITRRYDSRGRRLR